jgi:hypothetical protein
MMIGRTREIVVEVERIKLLRKRARSHLMFCAECDSEADFISVKAAASLFSVCEKEVASFVEAHRCHGVNFAGTRSYICVGSLISVLRSRLEHSRKLGPPQLQLDAAEVPRAE